ncbi:MAG: hypothetical protein ACTSWY_09750 [Promethearchaeota archaeon]
MSFKSVNLDEIKFALYENLIGMPMDQKIITKGVKAQQNQEHLFGEKRGETILLICQRAENRTANTNGEIKEFHQEDFLTIKNTGKTDKLWNLGIQLANFKKEFFINELKPAEEWNLLLGENKENISENIEIIEKFSITKYIKEKDEKSELFVQKKKINTFFCSIFVTNKSMFPITDIFLIKNLPATNIEMSEVTTFNGKVNKYKKRINWEIESLRPNETVVLNFKINLRPKPTRTGKIHAQYRVQIGDAYFYSVKAFNASLNASVLIDVNEVENDPGNWNCNLKLFNKTEFLIDVASTQLIENIGTKRNELYSSDIIETVGQNQEKVLFKTRIASKTHPYLMKKIKFNPRFKLFTDFACNLYVDDDKMDYLEINGKKEFSVAKIKPHERKPFNVTIKVKNYSSIPLNHLLIREKIPKGFVINDIGAVSLSNISEEVYLRDYQSTFRSENTKEKYEDLIKTISKTEEKISVNKSKENKIKEEIIKLDGIINSLLQGSNKPDLKQKLTNLSDKIDELSDNLNQINNELEKSKSHLNDKKEKLQKERKKLEELKRFEENLIEKRKLAKNHINLKEKLDDINLELEKIQGEKEKIDEKIGNSKKAKLEIEKKLEGIIKNLENLSKFKKDSVSLDDQISSITSDIEKTEIKIQNTNTEIDTHESETKLINEKQEKDKNQLKELEKIITQHIEKRESVQNKIRIHKKNVKKLEDKLGKIIEIKQTLLERENLINKKTELENKLKDVEIEANRQEIKKQIQKIQENIEKISDIILKFSLAESEKLSEDELQRLFNEETNKQAIWRSRPTKIYKKWRKEKLKNLKKVDKGNPTEEILILENIEEKVVEINVEIRGLKTKIEAYTSEIDSMDTSLQQFKNQSEEIKGKLTEMLNKQESTQNILSQNRKVLNELKSKLKELEELKQNILENRELGLLKTEFSKVLNKVQSEIENFENLGEEIGERLDKSKNSKTEIQKQYDQIQEKIESIDIPIKYDLSTIQKEIPQIEKSIKELEIQNQNNNAEIQNQDSKKISIGESYKAYTDEHQELEKIITQLTENQNILQEKSIQSKEIQNDLNQINREYSLQNQEKSELELILNNTLGDEHIFNRFYTQFTENIKNTNKTLFDAVITSNYSGENLLIITINNMKEVLSSSNNDLLSVKYSMFTFQPGNIKYQFPCTIFYDTTPSKAIQKYELSQDVLPELKILESDKMISVGKTIERSAEKGKISVILIVRNYGAKVLNNLQIIDILPKSSVIVNTKYDFEERDINNDKKEIIWHLDRIMANEDIKISYTLELKEEYDITEYEMIVK